MGLFKRNRKKVEELKRKYEINNERHAAACPKEATTPAEPPVEVAKPQENWIWVEGYKGTDKDMKAYGSFQYELGKQYNHESEIEVCKQGFHFCRDLKDVFNYYKVDYGHRFFKVKALVKESDYEKYGRYIRVPTSSFFGGTTLSNERINKLVAKSIILEEEVSKTDIIMAYYQYEPHNKSLPEEYWDTMIRNGYPAAYEDWQVDNLIKAGYSPVFAKCIYQDNKTEKALAIADQEGVSMDMKVWYIYH
jgi:hypothetical protein